MPKLKVFVYIATGVSILTLGGLHTGILNPYRIARKIDFWRNHPRLPLEIDQIESNLADIKTIRTFRSSGPLSKNQQERIVSVLRRLGPYKEIFRDPWCGFVSSSEPRLSGLTDCDGDELVISTSSGKYSFVATNCSRQTCLAIREIIGTDTTFESIP